MPIKRKKNNNPAIDSHVNSNHPDCTSYKASQIRQQVPSIRAKNSQRSRKTRKSIAASQTFAIPFFHSVAKSGRLQKSRGGIKRLNEAGKREGGKRFMEQDGEHIQVAVTPTAVGEGNWDSGADRDAWAAGCTHLFDVAA